MPVVHTDDAVEIAYRVVGGGPRTLLFIHGWANSSAVWTDLVEVLDSSGLRLLVPDLRGTGASARPAGEYTLERACRDLLAVADHAGAERFALVGHSMGGTVAQYLSATWPERVQGQVLFAPMLAGGVPLPEQLAGIMRGCTGNREAIRGIYTSGARTLRPESIERLLDDAMTIPAPAIEGYFDAWQKASFTSKLSAIRAPTLVVVGDDPFLSLDVLRAAVVSPIQGARLAYLPGVGHNVMIERPHGCASLLQAFAAALAWT